VLSLDFRKGENCEGGDVCVGVSTNAREGVLVLIRGNAESEVCLTEAKNGLEKFDKKSEDCTLPQEGGRSLVKAIDDLADGQAIFTTGELEPGKYIHFTTVMAY